jgi:hypothetical protein
MNQNPVTVTLQSQTGEESLRKRIYEGYFRLPDLGIFDLMKLKRKRTTTKV